MANRCIFVGRVVSNPQLTETSNNTKVCRFALAVKRDFATGNNQADFIDFCAFKTTADYIGKYVKKGMLCYVEGRLQTFTKNGNEPAQKPEKGFNIAVDKFDILSTKEEMKNYHNREQVENRPTQNRQKPKSEEDNSGYTPFDDNDDLSTLIPF